mgnify:CR=1 FL=1
MAWIIEENKLDAQQRNFLDNVDINRKNVWMKCLNPHLRKSD